MQKTAYFFYLLFILLTASSCSKGGDPQVASQENTSVTIDNYNQITVGMTYAQVVAILKKETTISGTSYSWSADDTNSIAIYLVIANSKVQSKSQVGLASPSSGSGGSTGGSGSTGSTGSNGNGCAATHNGHTVYTGPRGGCYYINSKGNKTYI